MCPVRLICLLLSVVATYSRMIPENLTTPENNSDTSLPEASHISQVFVAPNQNYGPTIQHPNNQNSGNPQNEAALPSTSFYNLEQQPLSTVQQGYISNPLNSQTNQNGQSYQQQSSQYNTNFNSAANFANNNQPSSFSVTTQTQQVQTSIQNVPPVYGQNNYATNSDDSSKRQSSQTQPSKQQQISDEGKGIYAQQTSDFVDAKTKEAKRIPLVLITIHKNKSKTGNKKETSKEYESQFTDTSRENSAFSESINSGSFSNYASSSGSGSSSDQQIQNSGQLFSSNAQQQPNQGLSYAGQFSQGILNPRSFGPLTQYRYPVLAGKKLESSEWKPVDGITNVPHYRNLNSGSSHSAGNQQNTFSQNQIQNLGSNAQGSKFEQSSQQNSQVNYNTNLDIQQNHQNGQNFNAFPSQTNTNNLNNQVTSTYVQQSNTNIESNPAYNSRPTDRFTDSTQNNNAQGLKNTNYQSNAPNQQNSHTSSTRTQTNAGNGQFSASFANQNNFASVSDVKAQSQANFYQSPISQGNSNQQRTNIGNTFQGTTERNANTYRNIGGPQNNYNQNTSPQSQNTNQNSAVQFPVGNNLRNNHIQLSNNVQNNNKVNVPSSSTQNTVNNANIKNLVDRNIGNIEQQVYNSNGFNKQPEINNFARSFSAQSGTSTTSENQNSGTSQHTNNLSFPQFPQQNNLRSYQQNDQINNLRNQQNTHNSIPINNQQGNRIQNNYFQATGKTPVESNKNSIQNQAFNQNVQSESRNPQYVSNQNNNQYQNNINQVVSLNNRQNNLGSNNQQFNKVDHNIQSNKESVSQGRNPSFTKQDSFLSKNAGRQSEVTNYNAQTSQNPVGFDNVNKNINYDDNRGASVFENNRHGFNPRSATNYSPGQQTLSNTENRDVSQSDFRRGAFPNKNTISNLNSNQNTNYGSSESKESVIGASPDEKTRHHEINENKYSNENQINFSNDSNQYQTYSVTSDASSSGSSSKNVNVGNNQDSAPEALLLVLVSTKRSELDDYDNGRKKDDINEGYESAPEEIMEMLNEEESRKMIIESVQEAAKAMYGGVEPNNSEISGEQNDNDE